MSHIVTTTVPFVVELIAETGYQCWFQLYSLVFWVVNCHWKPTEQEPISMIKGVNFFDVTIAEYDDDFDKTLHDSDSSTLVDEDVVAPSKPKSDKKKPNMKDLLIPWKSKSTTTKPEEIKKPFLQRFNTSQEQSSLLKFVKKKSDKSRISFLRRKTLPDIHSK